MMKERRKTYPLIGPLQPQVVSEIFGTGFGKFETKHLHGLAKVSKGPTLEILAIVSLRPRRGHLRKFVQNAQREYKAIRFWDVVSLPLDDALDRYGFKLVAVSEPTIDGKGHAIVHCRDWPEALAAL